MILFYSAPVCHTLLYSILHCFLFCSILSQPLPLSILFYSIVYCSNLLIYYQGIQQSLTTTGYLTFPLGDNSNERYVWSVREHLRIVYHRVPDSVIPRQHDHELRPNKNAEYVSIQFGHLHKSSLR